MKLTDIIGDNKGIRRAKIKISSYKEVCFTYNLGDVTRKVKDLPLIIGISGDQFKEKYVFKVLRSLYINISI